MSYLLGIDVGTTRTAAAVVRAGARSGESEIVRLGDRSVSVPSVLHLGDDGTMLVGDAAERRATIDPERVVREFKRRIGDPTPLVVGGRAWAPEELSARLVRWVVDRVAQHEGGSAARIAVTHPASWGPHKKDRLGNALAAQGMPVTFLAEPQAAALQYASAERVQPGSTIAVYDLGGGTFDAAVVHKDGHGFSLLGRPEGLERLGGVDFDEVVFEHVRLSLPEAFDNLDDTDPAVLSAVAGVRRECVAAKEALSSDVEVSIPVLTPAAQGAVRLHRAEFEAMIRPRIEDTVTALRRAVHSAGLAPPQLSAVLLVGGSSRIPLVGQLVAEQLGRPVALDTDPKNAIAQGAALSLTPAGGVGAPRVPAQRRPGPGATEVVRSAHHETQVHGGSARGYGSQPTAEGATAFVGPPAQRGSGTGSMNPRAAVPPGRPVAYPDRPDVTPEDYEYDHTEDPPPGRSPAALVGIGGAAAALVVIAAVFLLPGTDPVSADAGRFTPAEAGGPAVATTESATPTPDPDDDDDDAKPTSRSARPTTVVLTTVPLPTTVPPVVTTAPEPLPTTPVQQPPLPTTQPVTQPPPDPDPDDDPLPVPTQPVGLPPVGPP